MKVLHASLDFKLAELQISKIHVGGSREAELQI
jgi:hypothetical protein